MHFKIVGLLILWYGVHYSSNIHILSTKMMNDTEQLFTCCFQPTFSFWIMLYFFVSWEYVYACNSSHVCAMHACGGQRTIVRSEFPPSVFWDRIYFCRGAAYSVLVGSWANGQFCLSLSLIHTNAGGTGVSHNIWHFPWVLVIEFKSSGSHSQHFNLLCHILDSPFRCLIVFIVVWCRVSFGCSGHLELIR